MSKYEKRGAYHYADFANRTPYREHVLDLVEQVMRFVPKVSLPKVLEIGAGEGLILSQLAKKGLSCVGCDIDKWAVDLAKQQGNKVSLGTVDQFAGQRFDVVLLCDVLEHVKDFKGTIEAAKKLAWMVVVATPDRYDMHAERQPTVFEITKEFEGWSMSHSETRHARHLMIFEDCE